MSLQVLVAHTGVELEATPPVLESLDSLQQWLTKVTSIPVSDQILLTEKGRHVRLATLLLEKELFLYDRSLFAPASDIEAPQSPLPDTFEPNEPPDTLANEKNLKAWEALFKARRDWALDLVKRCTSMGDETDRQIAARAVIDRCVQVATGNKEGLIRKAEARYAELRSWFGELIQEQAENAKAWQADIARLNRVPARSDFAPFFVGNTQRRDNGSPPQTSLGSFVEREALHRAVVRTRTTAESFAKRIDAVGTSLKEVSAQYQELRDGMIRSESQYGAALDTEPGRLISEINAFARRISNDYETVANTSQASKSITSVSKIALHHAKQLLPAIAEITSEMGDLARRMVEAKNTASSNAIERLQAIATIEANIGAVNQTIQAIELPQEDQEAFEQLAMPSRLPSAYGSLLIEGVRRAEWIDKMKKDSSTLAEELAGYQEEEQRRRRKWLKSMSDILDVGSMNSKATGVEINLLGEEGSWPIVTRADLDDYMTHLGETAVFQDVLDTLRQAMQDLDKPTRQQIKRVKAFKAGSMHEAGLGKASLLLRGEDDARVLREANLRLEEELKSQKSRIRKLESLLHAQSSAGRLSVGGGFAVPTHRSEEASMLGANILTASPKQELLDDFGRRPSSSSRRLSTNQSMDDRNMARRLSALEAQLLAEQAKRVDLEKEVNESRSAQENTDRQVEEANSTKRDIMENMDAQQKEFARERRNLEEELRRAKQKIEEVEDELDRVHGSRMNERADADSRLQSLGNAVDHMKLEADAELEKAQSQNKVLQEEMQRRDQNEAEVDITIAEVLSLLNPGNVIPKGAQALLTELESLSRRCVDRLKDLEHTIAMTRSDNESLQTGLDEQKTENTALSSQIASLEEDARKVRQDLTAEQARAASVVAELEEERKHLRQLQSKFTDGESGTQALRRSLIEGENRGIRLTAELADAKSHANGLDVELSITQKRLEKLQAVTDSKSERLDQRSVRAKELTQRLYSQTDRLKRLLEALGFAIMHQDDTMTVQRASKANASAVLSDQSISLNNSTAIPQITKTSSEDMKLSTLNWMDKDDAGEEERKYLDYISTLDLFDVNVFSEAISKRMRDIEHTARKWAKESRLYREKAHKLHSSAQEKISYRSFKPGDLALFLPTRNQVTKPWAAFNVGAPHYFLRELDSHKLHNKEWLVARISKVEERVVDMSKAVDGRGISSDGRSIGETSEGGASFEDDNPFDLSDGLRWYLLDAAEEKAGAPGTPGLGRAAAATSARVDAKGSIRIEQSKSNIDAAKNLSRSLDSRRSSVNSKKGLPTTGKMNAEGLSADAAPSLGLRNRSSGSNASSLRPSPNGNAATVQQSGGDADEDLVADTSGVQAIASPVRMAPKVAPAGSGISSAAASPVKSTRNASISPTKRMGQGEAAKDAGLWNSLWRFDVNYESGGASHSNNSAAAGAGGAAIGAKRTKN